MYSVVLMAALTTAPTTQAWHRGGCHGCQGCYGYSCYGSANLGWYGYGSGCLGCYTGYNGWASGWGGGYYGWGLNNPWAMTCNGCYGCYGGWSCYGLPVRPTNGEGALPPPGPPAPGKKPAETTPPPREQKKPGSDQARARVIIEVPADAKLYIDDNLMPAGAGRRVFQTPNLPPGTYYYDIRAEVTRDGRVVTARQRIVLQPGQQAAASFANLGQRTDATARTGEQ